MSSITKRRSFVNLDALRRAVGIPVRPVSNATRALFALKASIIERYANVVASDSSTDRACQFAYAAVSTYWRAVCSAEDCVLPLRELSNPPKLTRGILSDDATSLGLCAAEAPRPDAAFALSAVYAALLPSEIRSRNGVFYTPPPLVDRLCDLVSEAGFDWEFGRIVDPACGGGAFLAPATARLVTELEQRGYDARAIFDVIPNRLCGVEIDPFSSWMAQVFVEVSALKVLKKVNTTIPNLVTTANALELGGSAWIGAFELVIGNPPYGRTALSDEARLRYSDSLYGHANLYGVFTHLATQLVRPGGVIGFVTPTSFLGGQYFQNLRRLLMERMPPQAIDFVEDRTGVFDDVLQETCLATYASRENPRKVQVHFLKLDTDTTAYAIRPAGEYSCNGLPGNPWMLPRESRQVPLVSGIARLPWRLKDYGYSVSTGPLVWNRHKEQLAGTAKSNCFPLIWAECVQIGGTFDFRCERRNHLPYFKARPGQEHLLCRNACVLVQRTTAKEQCRRLIAATIPAAFIRKYRAAVIENHLNMVRRVQSNGLHFKTPRISLATISAVLNSDIVDDVFRCISGSVAVSAFELESLPLPDPKTMHAVQRLIRKGATRAEIERRICKAYGIA